MAATTVTVSVRLDGSRAAALKGVTAGQETHWATGLPYGDSEIDKEYDIELLDPYECQGGGLAVDPQRGTVPCLIPCKNEYLCSQAGVMMVLDLPCARTELSHIKELSR